MQNKEYIGIDELCLYLKIGRTTAYKLIREKKIPAKKVASKWLIKKNAIDNYLSGAS